MHRKLLVFAICSALAAPAWANSHDANSAAGDADAQNTAQDQDAKSEDNDTKLEKEQQNAQKMEAVTVTGSLIRQPRNESTSPVQTINIDADIKTGAMDTADILMGTATASGSTQINGQYGGFIVQGGTGVQSVNLRGLGANRTLVLLDGQRPGPAGTRGQVAAFDLNVVPSFMIRDIDIVKDGASSIYGSDAVAGVINIITKKEFPEPEIKASVSIPQHGGGERYKASFANGWKVDHGNIIAGAQVDRREALKQRDRNFLNCTRDRVFGPNGQRVDIPDHSINQGTKFEGCSNMLYNVYLDALTGDRYVPSQDGHTQGPFPGYHKHQDISYDPDQGVPYDDQVTDGEFLRGSYAINKRKRASLYFASNLHFGDLGWNTQLLYNHRETESHGWRQFFPAVVAPYGSSYPTTAQGVYQPVMPYPSNSTIKVDYLYGATKLTGSLGWTDSWTWEVNATYSHSKGTYGQLGIDARKSGDITSPANEVGNPPINLLDDPKLVTGEHMQRLIDNFGLRSEGETVFEQATANALVTGSIFDWWAGTARAAFGAEFRHTKLNDTPDISSQKGWQWGLSSAGITKGTDNVKEAYAQVGIPLVSDVPGVQKLSVNMSGREFRYNSVGDKDNVWKLGVNWQITPSIRVRGSLGTSYKAPSLFQLYLADQTGFLQQMTIDPCIRWGESQNQDLRNNCAAIGIPDDYAGNGPTGTTHNGGGKGNLDPETSRAKTAGIVWTPQGTGLSLSLSYFDYRIRGEITTLGVSDITFGCYGRPEFPNKFCNNVTRKPGDADTNPFMITDVYATYINVNKERDRGYDLYGHWSHDTSYGRLWGDVDIVYQLSDVTQLFSTSEASGFADSQRIGTLGSPRTTAVFHAGVENGDWAFTWQGRFTESTRARQTPKIIDYFDKPNVARNIKAGWEFRHDVSVSYDTDSWGVTFGIQNLFDAKPPKISSGVANLTGNAALAASQYDFFGRRFFANARITF